MILPIITYGNPILRKNGINIINNTNELKELINNMFLTLRNSDGVGLSAHQIGKPLSLFIIDYKNETMQSNGIKKVFINPKITYYSEEKEYYKEGCLSIPEIYEEVKRPIKIKIKYLNENFIEKEEEYDDLLARIIQHEYDHINGILFIDRLTDLKRKILSKKLNLIINKKFIVNYKTK